ncbi:hypothetical protein [Qipengyuania seohaensis]|uniref:hypothetical protein n=1 Tax=Qipengyuania seohaensis TaxID=266951 RepID=UPI000C22788C|nr:hypothetical protein [Qipengyuania seohaensis]
MSEQTVIFAIIIAIITLVYSIPKLLGTFREKQISIPALKPFSAEAQPTLYWFCVVSTLGGILMAVVMLAIGISALVSL